MPRNSATMTRISATLLASTLMMSQPLVSGVLSRFLEKVCVRSRDDSQRLQRPRDFKVLCLSLRSGSDTSPAVEETELLKGLSADSFNQNCTEEIPGNERMNESRAAMLYEDALLGVEENDLIHGSQSEQSRLSRAAQQNEEATSLSPVAAVPEMVFSSAVQGGEMESGVDCKDGSKSQAPLMTLSDSFSLTKTSTVIGERVQRTQRRLKETWERRTTISSSLSSISNPLQLSSQYDSPRNSTSSMRKMQRKFLDKMVLVSSALLKSEPGPFIDDKADLQYDSEVTHQSNLERPGRQMFVVTTAAIPWFTGTAVNPLLRAAYLCRMTKEINERHIIDEQKETWIQRNSEETSRRQQQLVDTEGRENRANASFSLAELDEDGERHPGQFVTLVVPWLELEEDRLELYGQNHMFANQDEQELYIRAWLRNAADMPDESDSNMGLKILFYPARYHSGLKSIFAMGDICSLIPKEDADVCILEEPEHLNWYRAPGDGWTKKFNYVVGIVHTNYKEYASAHYSGLWTAPAIGVMSSAMVRAYCHRVIKLSDTLQTFAPEKEKISNVHGVRTEFLKEGQRRAAKALGGQTQNGSAGERNDANSLVSSIVTTKSSVCNVTTNDGTAVQTENEQDTTVAYFIGKILWAKGLDKMLKLQNFYKQCTGNYFAIDIYGSGPEEREIMRAFHGRRHHNGLRNSDEKGGANDEEVLGDEAAMTFSTSVVGTDTDLQIQRQFSTREAINKLSEMIKSTTESLEFDMPKTRHEWRRKPIPATFPGRVDHSTLKEQYKVFVNPSLSEVLCTTTAEALAMGKFVVIPVHPSNHFFMQFSNCLAYRNKWEFAANLRWALSHEPDPLTPAQQNMFTWEAATERLINATAITRRDARECQRLGSTKLDERIAWFHNELGKGVKGDVVRKVLGGGPIADQVRYSMAKREAESADIDDNNDDGFGNEDDEGLSSKFTGSTLARALRTTFSNGVLLPGSLPDMVIRG